MVTVRGMGGSGKTAFAAATARKREIGVMFSRICFVGLGQEPAIRDLQRSLHFQLCDYAMESHVTDEVAMLKALHSAAEGQTVLLIIDDAWDTAHVTAFDCIDRNTRSRILLTTRLGRLIDESIEFALGLLPPDEAVSLLLSVAGAPATQPYSDLHYRAAAACGHLPLVLAIGGGMLENYSGGVVTEDFIALLNEDRVDVMRTGEYGDEHVNIEDRLITNSLSVYKGAEKESVVNLFLTFAIFPEGVCAIVCRSVHV